MKMHIGSNGPARCNAIQGNCPYGEADHFQTKVEAIAEWERRMAAENGLVKTFKKESTASLEKIQEFSGTPDSNINYAPKPLEDRVSIQRSLRSFGLADGQVNTIIRAFETGKITDSKADELIDHMERNIFLGPYVGSQEEVDLANKLKNDLIKIRAKSKTPYTFSTVETFDPSKETIFSNPVARRDPYVARRALKANVDKMDWYETLKNENLQNAKDNEEDYGDPESARRYKNYADYLGNEVRILGERNKAMMKEMAWCYKNDPDFKKISDQTIESRNAGKVFDDIDTEPGPVHGNPIFFGQTKKVK